MKKTLKITRLLILLLVMFSLVNINTKASEDNNQTLTTQITGDLTKDGEVDTSDVIYLLMHTYFKDQYPVTQDCDYNKDGEVNTEDVIYLLMHTYFKEQYPLDTHTHNIQHVEYQEATCSEDGNKEYYYCSECEKYFLDSELTQETTYKEVIIKAGHNYVNGECTECGDIYKAYTYDSDNTNIIYFGSYPQSEVTDSSLKTILSSLSGTLPTSSNNYNWTSYGYYISGEVSNYMWYIDINYNKEKYRGVYFTSYRPYFTTDSSSISNSNQDDNGYYTSTVYWFKYEPIKWQILTESNGKAFLLADIALDSQEYYASTSSRTINGTTIYANNYEYSTIREWLNETFYNTAFNELEKEIIQTTLVDNSASSTGYSSNSYACNNTNDKVFLLSYEEATTYLTTDTLRIRKSTDYAKSQGCYSSTSSSYLGNTWWWLRSPIDFNSYFARSIHYVGNIYYYDVSYTLDGVVPALWINLCNHDLGDWIEEIKATCTEEGTKGHYHCSVCNKDFDINKQELTDLTIEVLGHNYVNGECTKCGDKKASIGLKYKLNEDQTSYSVVGIGTCTDNDIVIPSTYNDLPVTSVGYAAFSGCTSLTSVEIPSSVTSICSIAFSRCTSLENVYYNGTIEDWCNITFSYYSNPMSYANHFYMKNSNNKYEEVTEIEIPNTITEIGNYQFWGFNNVTKVTIPNNVTSIGNSAFYRCTSLTSIEIPSSVTSIGNSAFSSCTSLEAVIFEENSKLTSIGEDAFYQCTNLTSIEIPNSVTSIGYGAFGNCNNLTSIEISSSVTSIGYYAFNFCTSLTSINVDSNNKNYKSIDGNLYSYDKKTLIQYAIGKKDTSFEIPNSVTSIGEGAFAYCSSITSIKIPNSVTSIGDTAFCNCTNLTNIEIPIGVTSISDYLFFACISLTNIVIPSSVTYIGDLAFSYCINLTSIEIPNSVTSIGEGAFEECTNLEDVYYNGTQEGWNNITFSNEYSNPMYYAKNLYLKEHTCEDNNNDHKCDICDKTTSVCVKDDENANWIEEIKATCTEEGIKGHYHCTVCNKDFDINKQELTDLTIEILGHNYVNGECTKCGDKKASIGLEYELNEDQTSYSVAGIGTCTDKDIVIPSTYNDLPVISIDSKAFSFCRSLTNIEIPSSVTSIDDEAFSSCTSLENVYYNGTIEDWCKITFSSYYSNPMFYANHFYIKNSNNKYEEVTEIEIPNTITEIGNYQFCGFSKVTKITIPNSVTNIGGYAFDNCTNLTSINVDSNNKNYTSIDGNLYSYDEKTLIQYAIGKKDTSFEIPNSVTSIGYAVFSDCTNLTSIEIPNSVISIGRGAFWGCTSLTSIEIPSSVTSIDSYAFNFCTSLKTIIFEESSKLRSIDWYVFANCSSLTNIEIPSSVTSIVAYAFYDCTSLTSVEIPNSVTSIGDGAFQYCTNLTSIKIPNNVTSIGGFAFYGCTSLTSIEISSSVTSIGRYVFYYCRNLTSINVDSNNKNYTSIDGNLYSYDEKTLIQYAIGKKDTSFEVPNSVTSIGEYAFCNCTSLTTVINNSDLELTIGSDDNGFIVYYAYKLINKDGSITYKDEDEYTYIETTDDFLFRYDTNNNYQLVAYLGTKDTVTLPEDINGNSYEIYEMKGVRNVIIPNTFTSISKYAFYECTSLTSVEIPNSVTSIGYDAFYACTSLEDVYYNGTQEEWNNITFSDEYSNPMYYAKNLYLKDHTCEDNNNDHKCDTCDKVTSVCAKDDENANWIEEVKATCTEEGIKGHYHCSVCNKDFDINKQELTYLTIEVLGHNYVNGECTKCGDKKASIGLEYELNEDQVSYSVAGIGTCTDKDIVIPSTYNDLPVTSISVVAFFKCSTLTSVKIPSSVTNIGDYAFDACTSLTSIEIPNSITSIGYGTFKYCKSLRSIEIPNSITSIGYGTFKYCKSLRSIEIPNSVTNIGEDAFWGCTSLTSIVIPNSVTSIGEDAFWGCTSLTTVINNSDLELTIGSDDNGYIAYYAYKLVNKDGSITYKDEDEYTYIETTDDFLFRYDTNNNYQLVAYLGTKDTVTLPEDINGNSYEIYHMKGVRNVIIPDTFTSIGDHAFYGCTNLTSIEIPNSVTSIDRYAFYDCTSLTSIEIPNSVTSIGNSAFSGCISLTSIEIPSSVTSIGAHAFRYCTSLASIEIPSNVTSIGYGAFEYCTSLTSINVDSNNKNYKSIEGNLYSYDEKTLIQYAIGKKDTSFEIPNSVISIGYGAFSGCTSLTSIAIPSSVTNIGTYAFCDCRSLTSIEIPNSVTSIGYGAFHSVRLRSIEIPNSVISIDSSAFSVCSNLKTVIFEENSKLTSIGYAAFSYCSNLTTIEIPNSVTSIDKYAFLKCTSLEDVYYNGTQEEWNNITFSNEYSNPMYYAKNLYLKEHTCEDNNNDHICDICDKTTSVCAKDDENANWIEEIKATCTKEGTKGHYHCTVCNKDFDINKQELTDLTIEVLGHNYVNGECTKCGDKKASVGLKYELNEDQTSYSVAGIGTCTDKDIVIPSTYNGLPVTSIDSWAFPGCTSLTSIEIPNSVTSIGDYAFHWCTNLTSIEIPNSVTSIGDYAFHWCTNLTSIKIPNSVTSIGNSTFYSCSNLKTVIFEENSKLTSIGNYAFYKCTSLTSIKIPNSVTSIVDYAFYRCTSLTSVEIPSSVTIISDYAFCECTSLTSIEIPNSVTSIGNSTFSSCSNLKTVIFEENSKLTSIGNYAFYDCISLTSIKIPNSVTSIGEYAFIDCSNLTSIEIPSSITSIGEATFCWCTSLTSIEIPSSVTSIGEYAFTHCFSLTSIEILSSVTSIGSSTFYDCTSLTTVINNSDLELTIGSNDNGYIAYYAYKLINKDGSITYKDEDEYTYIETTDDFLFRYYNSNTYYKLVAYLGTKDTVTLPKDINGNSYKIYQMKGVRNVIIPNSVTSIGDSAFRGCDSLTSVEIPNSVTSIGEDAFHECFSLENVYYEGTIEDWCNIVFSSSSSNPMSYANHFYIKNSNNKYEEVTEIEMPNTITKIGNYQFCGFNNVTKITIPNSVTSIGEGAFNNCYSLTNIEILNSVTSIGEFAFWGCTSLTSIVIPSSVTSIGENAFHWCTNLASINVDSNNKNYTSIDGNLYSYDKKTLIQYAIGKKDTSFEIPNSATSIGSYAFYLCTSLTSIEIPNSVTSIGDGAFYVCSSLKTVIFEENSKLTSIGEDAFYYCTSLASIEIPNSVISIGWYAFFGCTSLEDVYYDGTQEEWNNITFSDEYSNPMYYAKNLYLKDHTCEDNNNDHKCDICDKVTSVCAKDDENANWIEEIEATCTKEGTKGHYHCSVCNKDFDIDKQELTDLTIEVLGHNYVNGECTKCGDKKASIGLEYELNEDQVSYSVAGIGTCTDKDIVIPSTYNGLPVTSIGYRAFEGCTSLTSIEIPSSVTIIGWYAFYSCASLTSIEIPSSVTSIGGCAFSSCTSLTSVKIPNTVTSTGYKAFSECTNLTSIKIPNSVTSIDEDAFYNCSNLKTIIFEKNSKLTIIGNSAFSGCTNLTSIEIPSGVTSIFYSAFSDCTSLISIEIPNSVTSIGCSAFSYCTSLINIVIPNSVTSIDSCAFENCTNLTSIVIPNSVTSIGDFAFLNCTSLTTVINNSDLELTIGSDDNGYITYCAYKLVNKDGSITYKDEDKYTYIETADDFLFRYYNYNSKTIYQLVAYLGTKDTVTLPEDINGNSYEIYQMSGVRNVIIPNTFTSISNYAFSWCESLTSIEIPNSITSIGWSAFYECTSLTSIEIPSSVTSIGGDAFEYCTSLTSIEIPSSVTSIGSCAFEYCTSLTSINVDSNNKNYTSIEGNLYSYDEKTLIQYAIGKKDTSFEIPSNVTSIGNFAFSWCESLTSIEIPSSVTSIGSYAFSGCTNLTIYCESTSKPSGWSSSWNNSNCPVVWGYDLNQE